MGCSNPDASISRICTHILMTPFLRAMAASEERGTRTLSATASLCLPCRSDEKQPGRWERVDVRGRNERDSDLFKNMRRMRLPLVPVLESVIEILY